MCRLSWELRDAAAVRGSPVAQGEIALVQLYGMTPPPLNSKADFGGFSSPDEAAALTHLFFSATGGDAFGRAALGHKFRRGLGVPEVCPTASMYFQPLADEIIEELSDTTKKLAPVCFNPNLEIFSSVNHPSLLGCNLSRSYLLNFHQTLRSVCPTTFH